MYFLSSNKQHVPPIEFPPSWGEANTDANFIKLFDWDQWSWELRECQMLCSNNVEPPQRLSSTMPIPITTQCCEFPTQTKSECQVEYYRNCDLSWIQEPCAWFFGRKQNFWFDWVFNWYFGWGADVVDLLSATLVNNSRSLFVSSFKGVAISLDMFGFLAIDANSNIPELALAPLFWQRLGRTSYSTVRRHWLNLLHTISSELLMSVLRS